ncbi:phosphatidylinositol n-acetylglucosaminyltransferase gpi3 subunit [Pyrenophora seminiperda CCB06]|uniref:Phosphatidylinositol n-acetylglucosaminyltransferase gpi3 subunit n=1 Tax=Pyrenophora seminiperda CCB06 TaxID=1302712 RepID=A0A3M7MF40_9PLEO|nr:phosphatidylinositol n-acetylglucosaminyltransferase gpi3 subunit [Pyrenophora seminiperda CCB06]
MRTYDHENKQETMSQNKNPDAVSDGRQFAGHVAGSEPLMKGGHQPGLKTGNDAAPEYHAQTLPAGSAPAHSTHTPNPDLNNQGVYHHASDTLQGATSADVHTGHGHPGQGQTSQELHDGRRVGQGLAGLKSGEKEQQTGGDLRDLKDLPEHAAQRNLGDVPTGQRGNVGGPAAEEREPERVVA